MNESMTEVIFKVHAEVRIGEEIRVSGNVPALGSDDPARSVPLITSAAEFPWWHTKEGVFLPGDPYVQYRYCIFSGGKFDRWEDESGVKRSIESVDSKGFTNETEDELGCMHLKTRSPQISPSKHFVSAEGLSFKAKHFADWNHRAHADKQIDKGDAVIMVSYFLPVVLTKKANGSWSATWDKENILSLQMDASLSWVGSVRYQNAPIPEKDEEAVTNALAEINCHPVFISQSMHFQFYDMFCKQNLWPIMHHIADVYGPLNLKDIGAKAQQSLWYVYSMVHRQFRAKVLEMYHSNDLIWIHGFHLLLLPSFLRRRIPSAKIGYFFHTPFPSSEIWRTMSRRGDLLRGILGADQIGFHLYEYARHFLTNCQRLLGCSYERSTSGKIIINVDGREVALTCIHVGVDYPRVDEILMSRGFEDQMRMWRERFAGKIVVAGMDRLERLKGIPLKLVAIEQFMEENPQWLGKIVFTLIGISAGERGQDYRQTQHDVKIVVRELNEKYSVGGDPLIFFEERLDKDIRLAQRLAFFAVADILMITATRDGLNRYPMEFTLARQKNRTTTALHAEGIRPEQGMLIISEFVSSARVMRGSLVVNPWRVQEVKSALLRALEMGPHERADRMRRNLEFSARMTTSSWATQVLSDLKSVEKSTDPDSTFAVGFGMQYKIMDLKAGFHPLDHKEVCISYRTSRQRLILLDWGGTLEDDQGKADKMQAFALATGVAERTGMSQELRSVLEALAEDPKNIVFVVSGREQPAVAQYFGSVPNLGVGAEHGFYYKWPRDEDQQSQQDPPGSQPQHQHQHQLGMGKGKGRWQTIMEVGDQSWKETARVVMDIFAQRTHGTYIEQKGNALIWQFSEADPEFGFRQSKELVDHLHLIMASHPVEILRGGGVSDGYIEVRPAGASKGLFLKHCLSVLAAAGHEADFVMAVGDDASDEPMFDEIERVKDQPNAPTCFAVTVGKKPTSAGSFVDDPTAVVELLNTLSKSSQREIRHFSMMDLPSQGSGKHQSLGRSRDGDGSRDQSSSPLPNGAAGAGGGPGATPPMLRCLSAGDLDHRQAHMPTVDQSGEFGTPKEIPRINSIINLSMIEYMKSINENEQDEDDGGIFF